MIRAALRRREGMGFISGLTIGLFVGVSGTLVLILGSAAFYGEGSSAMRRLSSLPLVLITVGLVSLAWTGHIAKIGKASSLLLLLLAVRAIARYAGLVHG